MKGTGFELIVKSYQNAPMEKKPDVLSYAGFLVIRLKDLLYMREVQVPEGDNKRGADYKEIILHALASGPKEISYLQALTPLKSRPYFIKKVINPLLQSNKIVRLGSKFSPTVQYAISSRSDVE